MYPESCRLLSGESPVAVRARPPHIVQVHAWAWLAADTDDLAEKERCLETILELEPDAEWARMALLGTRQRRQRPN